MVKHLSFGISLLFIFILGGVVACTASSYENPPQDLQESDLWGVWEVKYEEKITDRLIIREDGTFKQQYQNKQTNYVFETDWMPYWLERKPDGTIYLHLESGRYFFSGERIAELSGRGDPCPANHPDCISGNTFRPFFDPYTKDDIEMVDELILTIRVRSDKSIVFHHLWLSLDKGFAILGGESEVFHRANQG